MQKSDNFIKEGNTLVQQWFSGDHGCVGGGEKEKKPLSDIALSWMIDKAEKLGLSFDRTKISDGFTPNPLASFDNDIRGIYILTGEARRQIDGGFEVLTPGVRQRLKKDKKYQPDLQKRFKSEIAA